MKLTIWFGVAATSVAILLHLFPSESSAHGGGHCLGGCPTGAPATNDLVQHRLFTVSSNRQTKLADWVAYKVTADKIGPSKERVWRSDPAIPARYTLEPEDYRGAYAALGTDRGHLAPLSAFSRSPYWEELQLLSNVAPQKADLNRGPWMRLEGRVRQAAKRGVQAVWVVAGSLYERKMPPLPKANERHRVPSGFFKVIALPNRDGSASLAAFAFDQAVGKNADECRYQVAVVAVENRTGLSFTANAAASNSHTGHSTGRVLSALGCR